jgi:hypothetical protein
MSKLVIPPKPKKALASAVKDRLRKMMSELDTDCQASVIYSWQKSQSEFVDTGKVIDQLASRLIRFHRCDFRAIPSPRQHTVSLRPNLLSADGSTTAIVNEIDAFRDSVCQRQANHLVDNSLFELVKYGAIGIAALLPNGAMKIDQIHSGSRRTTDAIVHQQVNHSLHRSTFNKQALALVGKELADQLQVDCVVALQTMDEKGRFLPSPSQFLIARLGPFVLATSPRIVPRPSLFSTLSLSPSHYSLFGGGSSRRAVANLGFAATPIGLLIAGLMINSFVGTAMLMLASLLLVAACFGSLAAAATN